jgi:hypothetical protein
MSDGSIFGIGWAAGLTLGVGILTVQWLRSWWRSPSRQAARHGQAMLDAAVRGMHEGQQAREALGIIGTRNDVPTSSTTCCLVCGKPYREVGPMHRFEIKDDVRRCWTP